jgi:hypothetical protein
MRISDHYGLGVTQPSLDFVDVPIDGDVPLFVDPTALNLLDTDWGAHCRSLIKDYFSLVLEAMREGRHAEAKRLLASLNEPNETHLGYSADKPHGHGMGKKRAEQMWQALKESDAVRTGLVRDLEDTALMIDGVASDVISDIVTNIIREPLIEYTQAMCAAYGIPTEEIASGLMWSPTARRWQAKLTQQPVVDKKRLLLVPKALVRRTITYNADSYYSLYLLEKIQEEQAAEGLVRILKSGETRPVTKKSLKERFATGKQGNRTLTPGREDVLERYRQDKSGEPKEPLTHDELAESTHTPEPDWSKLLGDVLAIDPGAAGAGVYEKAIKKLFDALFYPWLMYPEPQQKIHAGRKRIDITYTNVAEDDFFAWLRHQCPAAYIFTECKNYSADPENPELDQLAGRFSPRRGRFGLLVARKITDKALFTKRCRDTADDDRGFIIALDDDDLTALVKAVKDSNKVERLALLRQKFKDLVM